MSHKDILDVHDLIVQEHVALYDGLASVRIEFHEAKVDMSSYWIIRLAQAEGEFAALMRFRAEFERRYFTVLQSGTEGLRCQEQPPNWHERPYPSISFTKRSKRRKV